jgi:hypothetical protein
VRITGLACFSSLHFEALLRLFFPVCIPRADWFNTWQIARILGFSPTTQYSPDALFGLTPEAQLRETGAPRARVARLPLHVVFLDGHNAGPMDDGWGALFLSFNYIKHFPDGVCFEDAIFAPYGCAAVGASFPASFSPVWRPVNALSCPPYNTTLHRATGTTLPSARGCNPVGASAARKPTSVSSAMTWSWALASSRGRKLRAKR